MSCDRATFEKLLIDATNVRAQMSLRHQFTYAPLRGLGWMYGNEFLMATDPDGVQLLRTEDGIQLYREGQELLRTVGTRAWIFASGQDTFDPPMQAHLAALRFPGLLGLMCRREIAEAIPTALWAGTITASKAAGRATWVLSAEPEDPRELCAIEIDQQTGVLLGAATGCERILAESVEFSDGFEIDRWTGDVQEFRSNIGIPANEPRTDSEVAVDTSAIPGFLDHLPPAPEHPRRLRVYVSESTLEGQLPDYRVGQTVELSLSFRMAKPPIPGLATTRRVWVHYQDAAPRVSNDRAYWLVELIGDGWRADALVDTPVLGYADVTGYFVLGDGWSRKAPTRAGVVGVVAILHDAQSRTYLQDVTDTNEAVKTQQLMVREAVVDVDLDEAEVPDVDKQLFDGAQAVVGESYAAQLDRRRPVARMWDVDTGRYLGQTLIPVRVGAQIRLRTLEGQIVADSDEKRFQLCPDQTVAKFDDSHQSQQPQEDWRLPAPWVLNRIQHEGLATVSTPEHMVATGLAVKDAGQTTVISLPPAPMSIASAVRVGERIIVDRWQEVLEVDLAGNVLNVTARHPLDPGWGSVDKLAFYPAATQLRFHDRATGTLVAGLDHADGERVEVSVATADEIRAFIGGEAAQLCVWRAGKWERTRLEQAPEEI